MVWARRISQGVFLLLFLFLFLQTEQKGTDQLGYPVKLFLDADPLLFLSSVLASRSVQIAFASSLILVLLTVLLGRVFCGWVCPLGTLSALVGEARKWSPAARVRGWFKAKYLLLAGLLVAALFKVQLVGLLDPLSLLVRSFSLGVHPAFNLAANALLDLLYGMDLRAGAALGDLLGSALKKTVLAFQQPHFLQGGLILMLFLGLLALNLLERRFWCRYLCPLGALLGLLSKRALLRHRISNGCTACGLCDRACQGGISSGKAKGEGWMPSECMMCMNCRAACPTGQVRFGFSWAKPRHGLDLGRRNVLLAGAGGVTAVAASRIQADFRPGHVDPSLIRPPGALPEPAFLARCVKCGECMKVCTTNGLQPTLFEAGLEGIWSPRLVPRIGYCEYNCTLCGQVCPTGAIRRLPLEEKVHTKIGTAMVDRSRCLPHAHAMPCIVCEEVCPVPDKAIWYEETIVKDRYGTDVAVKQPHVDLEKCIGCGICEAKCPVVDLPAIRVTSIGERRNDHNQVVLGGGYG